MTRPQALTIEIQHECRLAAPGDCSPLELLTPALILVLIVTLLRQRGKER